MPAALEPYVPSPQDPWDESKAAHLLRRTGFGPLPSEIAQAVQAGPGAAVASALALPRNPGPGPAFDEVLSAEANAEALHRSLGRVKVKDTPQLRAAYQAATRAHGRAIMDLTMWWLDWMAKTKAPLQEKLTLFWHGHFTSSMGDVHDAIAMYKQNDLFRRHAAGNFARLLDGVARDPAMLKYLDNDVNRRGHPNENWARELMELFTMGIGHYTENDVLESARAWTGWTLRGGRFEDRRAFDFKPRLHDDGIKTFLDTAGKLDGTDIMRIILAQPATPRWLAGKLAKFFVSPNPDPELVEAMAQELASGGYEITPVLRSVFQSRAFYRPEVMYSLVKGPTEYVVGAVRQLGIEDPDWRRLAQLTEEAGQHLFFPPTVAGWHGGTAWINAATVFNRANIAGLLVSGRLGTPRTSSLSMPETAAAQLLQRPLPPARQALLAQAYGRGTGQEGVHLIMSLPEYQVC